MNFFAIIKDITSWIALAAYCMALLAYVYTIHSLAKLKSIEKLPAKDRAAVLLKSFGPMPENISAAKWIEERRNRYYLIALIFTLVAIVATIALIQRQESHEHALKSNGPGKVENTTFGDGSPIINLAPRN